MAVSPAQMKTSMDEMIVGENTTMMDLKSEEKEE
jgi:hypothetical protein